MLTKHIWTVWPRAKVIIFIFYNLLQASARTLLKPCRCAVFISNFCGNRIQRATVELFSVKIFKWTNGLRSVLISIGLANTQFSNFFNAQTIAPASFSRTDHFLWFGKSFFDAQAITRSFPSTTCSKQHPQPQSLESHCIM